MAKKYTRSNFTEKQLFMLDLIHENVTLVDRDSLYVETGECKPWSAATHRSLVDKGLATVTSTMAGVYHVTPTEEGSKVAKELYESKYGKPTTVVTTLADDISNFGDINNSMLKKDSLALRKLNDRTMERLNDASFLFMKKLKETYPKYDYTFWGTPGAIVKVYDKIEDDTPLASISAYTPLDADPDFSTDMLSNITGFLSEINRVRAEYDSIGFNTALKDITSV